MNDKDMSGRLGFVLCLCLFSSVLCLGFKSRETKAFNGYPIQNIDTGLHYATIQEAIDAPETLNGHTIFVNTGIYFEHVIVSKSLSLVGEEPSNTIIDGNFTGNVLHILADDVKVVGFTIRKAGRELGPGYPDSCILAPDVMHVQIENNTVADGTVGILGYNSSNMTIRHNLVNNCGLMGIHFDANSTQCEIMDNTIEDNLEGIELERSSENIVEGNILGGNNASIVLNRCDGINVFRSNNMSSDWYNLIVWGWSLEAFIQDIGPSNIVNNKTVYFLTSFDNLTISASDYPNVGYLAVVNCTNITVRDFDLSLNKDGLLLAQSSNCVLTNITLRGNCGPLLHGGLTFFKSSDNLIVGNRMSNNCIGVGLCESNDNVFYHNSFAHNTRQVISNFQSPFSEPSGSYSINKWDNDIEGNYWSGYDGSDRNYDGIGDAPHPVTQSLATPPELMQYDNCPLMGLFCSHNVIPGHFVHTICNSSVSRFHFNGTAISFNVAGENGTIGFCRICIPTALMNNTFRVFVNNTEILPSPEPLPCSNNTHNYLYFTYSHPTQEIIVIPEFPSPIILPLLTLIALLTTLVRRRITCIFEI